MRNRLLIIFLFLNSILYAQNTDTTYSLDFNIKAKKIEYYGYILVNSELKCEFSIKGQTLDKYCIEIINDTVSILSRHKDGQWRFVDTISHMELGITDTNKLEFPLFEVTDFNKDGYQDLTCWIGSNMNGNRWTTIYLYNPKSKLLERLINSAEQDEWEIWDNPVFNPKDNSINCVREASIYGVYFESKYKLLFLTAIPIEKFAEDRTSGRYIIRKYYKGVNGKWRLIKKEKQ